MTNELTDSPIGELCAIQIPIRNSSLDILSSLGLRHSSFLEVIGH
jgi:hypothetical protein